MFLAANIANVPPIPHPVWMMVIGIVAPLAGGRRAQGVHRKPCAGEALLGRTVFRRIQPGCWLRRFFGRGNGIDQPPFHRQRPFDLVAQQRLEVVRADTVRGRALAQQADEQGRPTVGDLGTAATASEGLRESE